VSSSLRSGSHCPHLISLFQFEKFNLIHFSLIEAKQENVGSSLPLGEAQKILGLKPPYQLPDVLKARSTPASAFSCPLTHHLHPQRYEQLFKVNDPANGGSFYLQSKVFRHGASSLAFSSSVLIEKLPPGRARERLEQEFKTNAKWQAEGGGTKVE